MPSFLHCFKGKIHLPLHHQLNAFFRPCRSCRMRSSLQVRLRDPLPTLCQIPEIYDRSKVSADCFDALHCLRMLRKVNRLREAAEQELFPKAAQLIQVRVYTGNRWEALCLE